MYLIIALTALLIPAAAILIWFGPVTARRNARLRPIVARRLEVLIWTANEWKGSCHDFAASGLDASGAPVPGLMHLTPSSGRHWYVFRDAKKGIRVCLPSGEAASEAESVYPYYGWSREPWLKAKLDHLHEILAKLPPPRTHEEHMRMSRERHEAFMAEMAADSARMEKELADIRVAYPSLDDPCDDMD